MDPIASLLMNHLLPQVLIIDDDAEMRGYFEMALAVLDIEVRGEDGAGPIEGAPRVAFVDLLLAGGDGLGHIEALIRAGSVVVVTTGLAADAPLVEAARALGVRRILHKPFSLSRLREFARSAWAQARGTAG
ncbi:MAG: DNA-binding NtrC family response regulator [Bradymonadia bacterium]